MTTGREPGAGGDHVPERSPAASGDAGGATPSTWAGGACAAKRRRVEQLAAAGGDGAAPHEGTHTDAVGMLRRAMEREEALERALAEAARLREENAALRAAQEAGERELARLRATADVHVKRDASDTPVESTVVVESSEEGGDWGPEASGGARTSERTPQPPPLVVASRPRRCGTGSATERMTRMVRILAKLIPQSRPQEGYPRNFSVSFMRSYLDRVLGEAPRPQCGVPSWAEYLSELFSWASGREVTKAEAAACVGYNPGSVGYTAVQPALAAIGVDPGSWVLPLRRATMPARHADDGAGDQPVAEAGGAEGGKASDSVLPSAHSGPRKSGPTPYARMVTLLRVLRRVIPQEKDKFDACLGPGRVPRSRIQSCLDDVLGEAPRPQWGVPSPAHYLSRLFTYLTGREVTEEQAGACVNRSGPKGTFAANESALRALGVEPENWTQQMQQAAARERGAAAAKKRPTPDPSAGARLSDRDGTHDCVIHVPHERSASATPLASINSQEVSSSSEGDGTASDSPPPVSKGARSAFVRMRGLVGILVALMPHSEPECATNRLKPRDVRRYLDRVLGDAPRPEWGVPWADYMSQLLTWATGRTISPAEARACVPRYERGRGYVSDHPVLTAVGVEPWSWALPLRRDPETGRVATRLVYRRR